MRVGWALLALTLMAAAPAFADTAQQSGALPPAIASVGVTRAEWGGIRAEVSRQARRANVSEAALMTAAEVAGARLADSRRLNVLQLRQAIFENLSDQADQIAELQHRLDVLTGDTDPSISSTFSQARTALNEGRLNEADRLLAQAAESDLAIIQAADSEAERRRMRAGETSAARGDIANTQADYSTAAAHFQRAAEIVPQNAVEERWRYRMGQAQALINQGRLSNDENRYRDAIRLYSDVIAPLAPRNTVPINWALTQRGLGNALSSLSEETNIRAALVAYRNALGIQTRAASSSDWAQTQNNLGTALVALYVYMNDDAQAETTLREAIAAFRAALDVDTRERDPRAWAMTQTNLGDALRRLARQGDRTALRDAIGALRGALEVYNREGDPENWASAQSNLGVVLAQRGDEGALHDAVTAFQSALEVETRSIDPQAWAADQYNLAVALRDLARRGDNARAAEARAAAQNAMAGFLQVNDYQGAMDARNLIAGLTDR